MRSPSSQRLIRLAAQAFVLLCAVYFLWETLSYRGLYSRLAEFQIARFGQYAPFLTYLFLFCLFSLPVLLISWLLLRKQHDDTPIAEIVDDRLAQARRLRRFLIAPSLTAACVAVGLFIYSIFGLPSPEGEVQTIAASEAGAVSIKQGPARLVGGELGTIIFFGQDWFVGDDRMAFSPFRPSGSSVGAASFFVQLQARSKSDAEKVTQQPAWSGIIVEGGLPGPVRVLFNHMGVGIKAPYYTLYQDEYSLKIRYWLQSIQWGILAVFFAILAIWQNRSVRKLERLRDQLKA
jgi:hypothetical protein